MDASPFDSKADYSNRSFLSTSHSRREFLKGLGYGAAAWYLLPTALFAQLSDSFPAPAGKLGTNAHYPSSRVPLTATPYVALPLGAVRGRGWLLKQLELQRDGLTGHADELAEWMPALQDSAWTGGKGDAWERGPYYLKGLVALAYVLDDDGLKKKAQVWIDGIVSSQKESGFFGPDINQDWWPRMLVTYFLRDYYEATNDARILPFLTKYYGFVARNLPQRPLDKWAKSRAADEIDTLLWLYNRTGDASLITVAQVLRDQAFNWPQVFRDNTFFAEEQLNHNVNVCQAIKAPAAWHVLSGEPSGEGVFAATCHHLTRDHGLIMGVSTGTEHLAGKSPNQAVETCSTVEQMLSDETNLRVFGDPQWGDNLERVAFNALPAALSDTIHQHVYYTRPNHPAAQLKPSGYAQDSPDRFVPAPRSGFPCCCYNFHMGWPKYVQNMWAATHDNGLAVLVYGPSEVTAKVGSDTMVTITQETDYPFNETVRFKISTPASVQFPLELRVPEWCAAPQITVAGQPVPGVKPGSFARIDRPWASGDEVVVHFPMEIKAPTGYLRTVSLERGPLIYSLQLDAQKNVLKQGLNGFDQFELTTTNPWNYALDIDPGNPGASVEFQPATMPDNPFVAKTTPVQLTAKARRLPGWTFAADGTTAAEPPCGPVATSEPQETIRLVPFGAQFLRITQFPYVGTPPTPPTSFQDDFSGDDFADRWGVYGPGWFLQKGSLCCHTKKPSKTVALDTHFADFTYDAQVSVPPKGDAGLLFRVTRIEFANYDFNGYYVGLDAEKQIAFVGKSNGTWTELKRATFPIEAEKKYPVRIVTAGPKISIYVQDTSTPLLEIEDGEHTAGSIGVRQNTGAIPKFSQISVKTA
jgi:hypothetical protein